MSEDQPIWSAHVPERIDERLSRIKDEEGISKSATVRALIEDGLKHREDRTRALRTALLTAATNMAGLMLVAAVAGVAGVLTGAETVAVGLSLFVVAAAMLTVAKYSAVIFA